MKPVLRETPVTRDEIATHIGPAFGARRLTIADLCSHARQTRARTEVLDELSRLRRTYYFELRDLWAELGHLPVDLEEVANCG